MFKKVFQKMKTLKFRKSREQNQNEHFQIFRYVDFENFEIMLLKIFVESFSP